MDWQPGDLINRALSQKDDAFADRIIRDVSIIHYYPNDNKIRIVDRNGDWIESEEVNFDIESLSFYGIESYQVYYKPRSRNIDRIEIVFMGAETVYVSKDKNIKVIT